MNAEMARKELKYQGFIPYVFVDDNVYGKYEICATNNGCSVPFFVCTVWATRVTVCDFVEHTLFRDRLFNTSSPVTIRLLEVGK